MAALSLHDKFLLYLESTHSLKEEELKELIEFAENKLPSFLQSNGFPDYGELYSNLDPDFWKDVVVDGLPQETEEEKKYASILMDAIRYLKEFIKVYKKVDYDKLFAEKLKKEKKKAAQQAQASHAPQAAPAPTPRADYTQPEAADQPRKEGTPSQVSVTKYERNPEDRKKALERDNYECQVCHMKFVEIYGEIGKEYIEVHHLYPVCNMGENYKFDPLDPEKGLVCLCSNCHSMIHRGGHKEMIDGEEKMVPMTLKALQDVYNERNNHN